MAPAACPSLHELEGHCEYCGEVCDSTQDELNAITCTFEGCPSPTIYHQYCVETYLKTIRLDKQRKTGFQCPRGCGKGPKSDKPCPGRVTKSHPIHARNDSSKKRRKAKLFVIALPTLAPTTPVKKEKEDNLLHLNAPKSVKVEKDKVDTTLKLLDLNPSSISPSTSRSKGIASESVSAISSSITTSSGVRVLSRESTAAAIAAARSEIAANKRGSSLKNNTNNYASGRSDYSSTSFDSRLAQNLESSDDGFWQLIFSKDSRKVPPVGRCGVEAAPVGNPWTRGRCNELLNGLKENTSKTHPQAVSLNPSLDQSASTSSTSIVRPQVVRQPTGAERVGNAVGEEDDLEVRRLKARSKNEKKHLQRAARARVKREAEEAAAAQAAISAANYTLETESHSKQSVCDTNLKPWSESITTVLRQHKFQSLAKQLQEYGFSDWQSGLALRTCGSDVVQCLDWLLQNEPSMPTTTHVHREQKMDITSEMKVLKEVVVSEGFSQEQVELAVISTDGDIDAAFKVLRSLSSCCNSSQESSQGFLRNMVSSHLSFSQPSSQSSSELAIGEGVGMLNGTADGQNFSPLGWSVSGSDSQRSFDPFAGGLDSDRARCNSLLGVDDLHSSGNTRTTIASQFGECREQSLFQRTVSASKENVEFCETVSGGLHKHLQNSYELTASTVTSVATAVLKDTFGFDEQMISRMTDVIAANETPFSSIVSAVPSVNGIWSYPSSTFTSFASNKGVTNIPYADSISYNSALDGKSFSSSPFGGFGELGFGVHSDPTRDSVRNCFSNAGPTYASRWEQQYVKLVDEAEEQDRLMTELLSQLLV